MRRLFNRPSLEARGWQQQADGTWSHPQYGAGWIADGILEAKSGDHYESCLSRPIGQGSSHESR